MRSESEDKENLLKMVDQRDENHLGPGLFEPLNQSMLESVPFLDFFVEFPSYFRYIKFGFLLLIIKAFK